jgi:glyoxylase-like metal-dependent hydrolase (beta-lactamase superfamily II)
LLVVDPGSPYEDERQTLAAEIDKLMSSGRIFNQMVLTHVHPDHVAGVNHLRAHLEQTWPAATVTVAAHRLTAAGLPDDVRVDRFIEDDDVIELSGEPKISLRAMHTPGHARGHLCFHEARTGTLLTGDNILGLGSVLIDPPEGHMRDYLSSLERMRSLPGLSVLFPGHGPAIGNAYRKIDEYINHRLEREQLILEAVQDGATTPREIVGRAYTDVSPKAHAMAERAVLAHLEKLIEDGRVVSNASGLYEVAIVS